MVGEAISLFLSMAFPGLTNIDSELALNERARTFTVDNERFIAVPGLSNIEACFIDGVEIPLTQERPFWEEKPGKEAEPVMHEVPMLQLSDVPDVGTVLVRAVWSNNGIWQIGSKVVIVGDWTELPDEQFVSSVKVDTEMAKKDAEIAALKAQLNQVSKATENETKKGGKGETGSK